MAQDHYPFFGAAPQDAAVPDILRVFGMGGTVDAFQSQRLATLMDTSGPVWRWRADDPIAATLDPQSPEQFSKASQIRDLLAGGLPLKVSVVTWGPAVDAVEFASGGTSYRFTKADAGDKPVQWSANSVPSAAVALFAPGAGGAAGAELQRVAAEGPWALFRLLDKAAAKENSGPTAIKATFGDGPRSVTLLIKLPSENNPFSRGGVWSFRCPVTL